MSNMNIVFVGILFGLLVHLDVNVVLYILE